MTTGNLAEINKQAPIYDPRFVHARRVRSFAFLWTGVTLVVGAITFAALFTASGAAARNAAGQAANANNADSGNVVAAFQQPPAQNAAPLVAQITATPLTIIPTIQPTTEPVVAPVVAATATPEVIFVVATPNAAQDTAFDLGIAVQSNPDPSVYKLWMEMARNQLKLNWIKSQISWRDTEPVKGQINFGELDNKLALSAEYGVRVLVSITKSPDWARDAGAKIQAEVFDGPPANPQDLADFVAALLNRYAGKIHAIEVWNEPNIDREWTSNPPNINAARYVELLRVVSQTVKAIDPSVVVVSAGLAPTGANIPGAVTEDQVYMSQLIAAGLLQHADCVGAHHNGLNVPPTADWNNIPERVPPASFRGPWANPHPSWAFKSTLEGYAQKIAAAGSTTKLCITEFGWPSTEDLAGFGQPRDGFGFSKDNTLADQANFTKQAIELMQQWGFVRLAFVWNLNYGAQAGWQLGGPAGDNVLWSILGPNYAARPVWQVIVDMDFRNRSR
jgi:polysaccharide biosynthesis protein PslG